MKSLLRGLYKKYLYLPFFRTLRIYRFMAKFIIAIAIFIKVAKELGIIKYIAMPFAPIMSFMGLPEVYSIAWMVGIFNSNYASAAAIITLSVDAPINVAQLTTLSVLSLVAHSLIIEAAIAKRSYVRPVFQVVFRIVAAIIMGWTIHKISVTFNVMQEPVHFGAVQSGGDETFFEWLLLQLYTLVFLFVVIFAMMVLVRIVHGIGLMHLLTKSFKYAYKLSLVPLKSHKVTTIGLVVGVVYFGDALMSEVKRGNISSEDGFKSMTFLSLQHAIIEDNLIFVFMGANIFAVYLLRGFMACVLTALVIWFVSKFVSLVNRKKYFYLDVK